MRRDEPGTIERPTTDTAVPFSTLAMYPYESLHAAWDHLYGTLARDVLGAPNELRWDIDVRYPVAPDGTADRWAGARAPHGWIEHRGRRMSTVDLFADKMTLLTHPGGARWRRAVDQPDGRCVRESIGSVLGFPWHGREPGSQRSAGRPGVRRQPVPRGAKPCPCCPEGCSCGSRPTGITRMADVQTPPRSLP